jgi:cob(I)alamin adenosyltransferase
VEPDYIERLESEIDRFNADLPNLRSFVLPGGTAASAHLHVARTVVRRAERATWAAMAQHGDEMSALPATYLNRLSDLLFVLARHANLATGDILWKPGGERG